MVSKPRISIETFLERIKSKDVKAVRQQLNSIAKSAKATDTSLPGFGKALPDISKYSTALATNNRAMAIGALRSRVARNELNTFSQALKSGSLLIKDMLTPVGLLNTSLNIMISRFGSMIIIFGAVQKFQQFRQELIRTAEEFDTATRRLEGIVRPTFGSVEGAVQSLRLKMLLFAQDFGESIDQISNSMFFLASAGRTHAQILSEIDAVQKLSIATSKEMGASINENKKIVEVFAGLMNVYGERINDANTQQAKATQLASVLFEAFRSQQILIDELATGLGFAAAQASAMNISSSELIASLAVLNTGLIKGSKAGTSYTNMLRDIIKNQQKLREEFDFDVQDVIERGFRLTDTLILKVNRDLKDTSQRTELMITLMDLFNIRGSRALLSLAIQYENLVLIQDRFTDSQKDFNDAVDANVNSLKSQKQRFENISDIAKIFYEVASTGGRSYADVQKLVNDELKEALKTWGKLAIVIGTINSLTFKVAESTPAWIKVLMGEGNERDFKKVFEDISSFMGIFLGETEGLAESGKNLGLVWRFVFGEIDAAQFAFEAAQSGLNETTDSIDATEKSLGSFKKTLDSYIKTLNSSVVITDNFGRRLGFLPANMIQLTDGLDDIGEALSRFGVFAKGRAFDGATQNIADNFKFITDNAEIAREVIDDKFLSGIEKAFVDTDEEIGRLLENTSTKFDQQISELLDLKSELDKVMKEKPELDALELASNTISNIFADLAKKRDEALRAGEITTQEDEILKQLFNRVIVLMQSHFAERSSVRKEELQTQRSLMMDSQNRELKELRRFLSLRNVEINDADARLFKGRVEAIKTIGFVPTISVEGEKRITQEQEAVITNANERITNFLKENLQIRLGESSRVIGIIQSLEGKSAAQIVEVWADSFKSVDDLTKHQLNQILKLAKDFEPKLKSIIEEELAVERFESIRAIREKFASDIKEFEDQILAIETGALEDRREKIKAESDEVMRLQDLIRDRYLQAEALIIQKNKELDQEVTKETKQRLAELKRELQELIDKLRDLMGVAEKRTRAAFENMINITNALIKTLGTLSKIIDDVNTLIGDDNTSSINKSLKATAAMIQGVQQLIVVYQSFKRTLDIVGDGLAATAAKINLVLGVIGVFLSVAAIVADSLRSEEETRNQLQQEFLSGLQAKSITPDYGQARITQIRVSLNPIFQFLDARQLTDARQRELAEVLVDDIIELTKSRG